jgi:hypothetical protein
MHRSLSPFRLLISCLALGLALGCRSGGASTKTDGTNTTTTIDIENHDFNDMTVYVLVNGARTRLGIAPGLKTTVLTIPRYLVNGTTYLRFFADPIGGNRTPVSEEIDVSTGDALVMVINPSG